MTLLTHKPLVSVIIAVKNGECYLTAALHSIFQQSYSPFEILVIDDQSTDDTACVAKSFEKVQYIWHETQGVAATRNLGLQAAQGDLIAFLDHDDLWAPDKLRFPDWFARACDAGIPMAVISQVLLFKRIHADNLSADVHTNRHELLSIIRQSVERKRTASNL
jgi:glycosyltransferase involved in cell wall biosynthesis